MRRLPDRGRDAGVTLVEMLVTMLLFGLVTAFIASSVAGSERTARTIRTNTTLGEEARGTINRISRELRQAKTISAVVGSDGRTGMTFDVDFDNDGVIDPSATDPESLTYTYDGVRILLSAADDTGAVTTRPVLNGVVSSFSLSYQSSDYLFDCNGNGITTWQELDSGTCRPTGTTVGNNNGVLDMPELKKIDSIVLDFRVMEGARQQAYRTQIDLRNAR